MDKSTENIVKELRANAAAAKEEIRVNSYDFYDSGSLSALGKFTDSVFKDRVRLLRQLKGGSDGSDCTYEALSRRKQAAVSLAAQVQKRLMGRYPLISPAEEFIRLSAPSPALSFDTLNRTAHIEFAAALWILDCLLDSGRTDEALCYLPGGRDELDSIELPDVSDSVHSDDMIKGMMYVIRGREDEGRGRESYEAIIHLIGTETVCAASERFISDIRRVTDSLIGALSELQKDISSLSIEKLKLISDFTSGYDEYINGGRSVYGTDEAVRAQALSVLRKAAEYDERLSALRYGKEAFCLNYLMLPLNKKSELADIADRQVISGLARVDTADPYPYCFAFINLLHNDSDYGWIYNISLYVLSSACASLPWAESDNGSESGEIDPGFIEAALKDGDKYIVPPEESVFYKKTVSHPFAVNKGEKISFAQLVFIISGMIPPRRTAGMSYMKALFENSGLTAGEADILYDYLALAYSVSQRDSGYVFIDESEDSAAPEKEPAQTQEISCDDAEVRALKLENKKLKGIINRLEHKLRSCTGELQASENSLDSAVAELSELRSMIRRAESSQEEYVTTVAFPYTSKKRAVVFGGHESWLKAIRPLLKNVRFVDASAQPNTALIMNADSVWIQTNAISHSSFYKIIDIVRKHNIELHYFRYSSAEKCAEQYVLEDQAQN